MREREPLLVSEQDCITCTDLDLLQVTGVNHCHQDGVPYPPSVAASQERGGTSESDGGAVRLQRRSFSPGTTFRDSGSLGIRGLGRRLLANRRLLRLATPLVVLLSPLRAEDTICGHL